MRRMAVDQAKADLAATMRSEDAAVAMLAQATDTIRLETISASAMDGGDPAREQFSRWLAGARAREREAAAARDAAGVETSRVRVVLAETRASERAVEMMQERQAAERAAVAAKAEQAVLDEAGQEASRRRGCQ
jgi:flagellar biosynthesis chaperone FliJ